MDEQVDEAYQTATVDPPEGYLNYLTTVYAIVFLGVVLPTVLFLRCCVRWCKRRERRNHEYQLRIRQAYYYQDHAAATYSPPPDPEEHTYASTTDPEEVISTTESNYVSAGDAIMTF